MPLITTSGSFAGISIRSNEFAQRYLGFVRALSKTSELENLAFATRKVSLSIGILIEPLEIVAYRIQ